MGLTNVTPVEVIELLLKYNGSPPDENYSPFEFGEEVGRSLHQEKCAIAMVEAVFQRLPSGIATSFVEGFLEEWKTDSIRDALLASITESSQATSAANIVSLLKDQFGMEDRAIFDRINLMIAGSNSEGRDKLCLAIWTLVCGESYDVGTGRVSKGSKDIGYHEIGRVLSKHELSEYCRSVLKQCLDTLGR